jgi:NDP-sugar pyrophosphorylase family protein
MRTLLICPGERSVVPALSEHLPLALVPVLGQTLLEYWLSALAVEGGGTVAVLSHAREDLTRELVGSGERWGLNAEVIPESRELTPAEALLKYASSMESPRANDAIVVLDSFPGKPDLKLFESYEHWFTALRQLMPAALTVDRVGFNERRPGVWLGCHAHVSPSAQLQAPCWIGQHVFIGEGAMVGPGTIVEDGSFVEPGAELAESWVGPDTFVGQLARIRNSLAWGGSLVNWQNNSAAQVADRFLLCALRQPRRQRTLGWLGKLSDVYTRNKGEVGMLWKQLLLHKEG